MIVRSRGGWLRRVIASGATLVALGAVLVAPPAASAAPGAAAPNPELRILFGDCGPSVRTLRITGVTPVRPNEGRYLELVAYRADGTRADGLPEGSGTSVNPDPATGAYELDLPVNAGATAGVKIFLVSGSIIGFAPRAGAPRSLVADPVDARAFAWYLVGCADIDTTPSTFQVTGAPLTFQVHLSGFLPGVVDLSLEGGAVLTPSRITIPAGATEAAATVTIQTPPPCSGNGSVPRLTALQASPDGDMPPRTDLDFIHLYCPELTAEIPGIADNHLPAFITVAGTGWRGSGDYIKIFFDGVQLTNDEQPVTVDRALRFSTRVQIPQADCVPHTITAVEIDGPGGFAPPTAPKLAAKAAIPAGNSVKQIPFEVYCSNGGLEVTPNLLVETRGPQAAAIILEGFRNTPVELSLPGVRITPAVVTPTAAGRRERFTLTFDHQPECGQSEITATQPQLDPTLPPKVAIDTIMVFCPRLTATPTTLPEVSLPEPVSIGGDGWFPRTTAEVLWDGRKLGSVTPTLGGILKDTVTIPRSTCGTHRLEVHQAVNPDAPFPPSPSPSSSPSPSPSPSPSSSSSPSPSPSPSPDEDLQLRAVSEIIVSCNTPLLSVQPQVLATAPGPQKLDVKITGFLQGLDVSLALPGTVLDPAKITPSRLNAGEATVTASKQPACGQTTFTAAQIAEDDEFPVNRSATRTIHVFCPTFGPVTPTVLDTKLAGLVGMAGKNWVPNQKIQLLVDSRLVGTVTVGDTGNAADTPKLPRLACGKHELEAVQVTPFDADPKSTHLPALFAPLELRVKAVLTVACPPAKLAVNPGVTVDGNTSEAAGVGFSPGRKIILEWTYEDGTRIGDACDATASAGGTFIVTCLVLPNTTLGGRLLHAQEIVPPGDPVIARKADAPLLVVPGSMDRGDHSHGRFLERR